MCARSFIPCVCTQSVSEYVECEQYVYMYANVCNIHTHTNAYMLYFILYADNDVVGDIICLVPCQTVWKISIELE